MARRAAPGRFWGGPLSGDCSAYVSPPPEPELYVNLLATSRAAKGRNVGGLLLDEARAEARRRGLRLLRLDCYAGGDRKLNGWYLGQGFTEVGPSSCGGPGTRTGRGCCSRNTWRTDLRLNTGVRLVGY